MREYVMTARKWKCLLLLIIYLLGLAPTSNAGTKLVIATGKIPPAISEQLDQNFLTAVFQAVEKEMGRFNIW
jgi:hypothetical protein